MGKIITCLSCGYLSLEGPRGSYDICDICDWEDDIFGNNNPYIIGGANKISLKKSQENFLNKVAKGEFNTFGFKKDIKWRPLITNNQEKPTKSYFDFVVEEEPKNNYLGL